MDKIVIDNRGIKIREMDETDLDFFNSLRNLCTPFLHDDRKFSLSEAKIWFRKTENKYFIIEYKSKRAGYIRTSKWDLVNKNVYVGVDIDSKFRRRGVAFNSLSLFMNFLFEKKKFNKVSLEVLDFNTPAISLYKKLGFQEEGRVEFGVRNGKSCQSIIMLKSNSTL